MLVGVVAGVELVLVCMLLRCLVLLKLSSAVVTPLVACSALLSASPTRLAAFSTVVVSGLASASLRLFSSIEACASPSSLSSSTRSRSPLRVSHSATICPSAVLALPSAAASLSAFFPVVSTRCSFRAGATAELVPGVGYCQRSWGECF